MNFKIRILFFLVMAVGSEVFAQDLDYAKQVLGSGGSDRGRSIAVDAANNSLVTGEFIGTATFGAGEPNETVLTAGRVDLFVTKYAPDGSLIWVKQAGGGAIVRGYGIARDAGGNSVVTGYFQDTVTFGAGEPNATMLTSGGKLDIFVAKYAPDGAFIWARQAGNTSSNEQFDEGFGIAVDTAGNMIVTGRYFGPATFGKGEPNETVLTGGVEIFLAKYAPDGSFLWAKNAGGGSIDEGFGIAVDADGNSVVIGDFIGTATFGAGESNETVLTSAGADDIFVAKYAPNGSLLWATRAGGTSQPDEGFGITVDTAGNILATGRFNSTATFGAGEPNETVLTSGVGGNNFVAKYTSSGSLLWAKNTGSVGFGFDISVDANNTSLVTGCFRNTATFGAGEPNETVLTSAGDCDIFVAKYKPDGSFVSAKQAGGPENDEGLGIATNASGNSWVTGFFRNTATFGVGEPNETVLTSAGADDIFVARYTDGGTGIEVSIDIKPGSDPNSINPRSKGVIPVAILSTDNFDATQVDALSVEFGPNKAKETHGQGHIEDVDGDSDPDMVLHFNTQETGIQCGDTQATLTGETFGGEAFTGTDSIQTVGCK